MLLLCRYEIEIRYCSSAERRCRPSHVLVAPPLVLGELRKHFEKDIADRVAAEVPKTLTNHPVADIEKILLTA